METIQVEKQKLEDVKDRIKTFEDAVKELGPDHQLVKDYDKVSTEDMVIYIKLCIITAALNEGWKPEFTKEEKRWYPYFILVRSYLGSYSAGGVACAFAFPDASHAFTYIGSRLVFKTQELAEYAGKQFIDIYKDWICKIQK